MIFLFGFLALFIGIKVGLSFNIWYLVILMLLFIFSWWRFGKRTALIVALMAFIGILATMVRSEYLLNETYRGVVIESKQNYFLFQYRFQRFYVYSKNHSYEIGDILLLNGRPWKIDLIVLESQFDFQSYLHNRGVDYQLSIEGIKEVFLFPIRRREIINSFLNPFNNESKDLLESLLFGIKNYEGEVISSFQSVGLIQVIGLSGIHISALIKLQKKILTFLINEKFAKLSSIYSVFILLIFVPNSVPLWRQFLYELLSSGVGKKIFRYNNKIDLKSLIGGLMLLTSIYLVNSWAFVIGIGLSLIFSLVGINQIKTTFISNYLNFNLIVFIVLIPYLVFTQNEIHLLSWLFSGAMFFLLSILFVFGWAQFLFVSFTGFTSTIVFLIMEITKLFDAIDLTIFLSFKNSWMVVLFYVLFFLWMYFKNKKIIKLSNASLGLIFLVVLSISFPINTVFSQAIYFINVGQGDAILLRTKQRCLLIDTGGNISFDIAKNVLIPFFKKLQIYSIDNVIITHNDYDHNGALESLNNNFNIGPIINSKNSFPFLFNEVIIDNLNQFNGNDDNQKSLVLKFEFLDKTWLLMGDAPVEVETMILKNQNSLNIDVLKIGHHGSDTSSSYLFLKETMPKEAIISVGRNSYGHPSPTVINRLEKLGISVRRTDKEGTISYQQWVW